MRFSTSVIRSHLPPKYRDRWYRAGGAVRWIVPLQQGSG
jgi:hypothetical protein